VNTWGYGIFFSRAAHFAVRHCRVAGGIDCHVAYCRYASVGVERVVGFFVGPAVNPNQSINWT
jgi:hypothetical protein